MMNAEMMQKREFVRQHLKPLLLATGSYIEDVEYVGDVNEKGWQNEVVIITLKGDDKRIAYVTHDSLLAIVKDVARQVLIDL